MNLAIEKSSLFRADVTNQFSWYYDSAGGPIAWKFFDTVDLTVLKLAKQPDLGFLRQFKNPILHNLRSFRVGRPFDKLLIFYRVDSNKLLIWRLMHGSRDLPRRLIEPPGA